MKLSLLFLLIVTVLITGCDKSKSGGDKQSSQEDAIETIAKRQAEERREIKELKAKLKGREFRGLQMGIPIGNGVLRISIPTDDEGNEVVAPSQIRDAWLQEADRLRRDPPLAPDIKALDPKKDNVPPLDPVPAAPNHSRAGVCK